MKYSEFNTAIKSQQISKFQKTLTVVNNLFEKNTKSNMTIWYNDLFNKFKGIIENENLNDAKTLINILDIYKILFIRCKNSNLTIARISNDNINLNIA